MTTRADRLAAPAPGGPLTVAAGPVPLSKLHAPSGRAAPSALDAPSSPATPSDLATFGDPEALSEMDAPSDPAARREPPAALSELEEVERQARGTDNAADPGGADDDGHTDDAAAGGGHGDRQRSQASRLVTLARESYRLVLGEDGRCYAVDVGGPSVAVALRGRDGLRTRLARTYYARTGTAPAASALADALTVVEGMTANTRPVPVALRVARHRGDLVLDLADPTGRAVIIGPGGWSLTETSPVLFRRTALTHPLPVPDGDATAGVTQLRRLLNVGEDGFGLIVAWLLTALIPDIPHPILALTGEQGTAKSTAARFLVSLIDPSPAPLRSAPRDVRQWAVTAAASWTVALDNISTIPAWLSDTLCKAVTGDGIVDRALFTDDDVTVLAFRRALVMTSIDAGALAGDLAERLVCVELQRIDPARRLPDETIEATFRRAHPAILGGLLDLLADVLGALAHIQLDELPRMADFARVLAALDQVTGWSTLGAYTAAGQDVTDAVLDADVLACAIREVMIGQAVGWTGTAAELLALLTPDAAPPRGFPRSPRALSGQLRRLAPSLRSADIDVEFTKNERQRLVVLTHRPREGGGDQPSRPSRPTSQPP